MSSFPLYSTGGHRRPLPTRLFATIRQFLFSFDRAISLGLFTASAIALIAHKVTIILLHRPIPIIGLIIHGPFVFVFDIIVLILLHRGFTSKARAWNVLAGLLGVLIACCSATFVSLYLETNSELNWGRTVEVPRNQGSADM